MDLIKKEIKEFETKLKALRTLYPVEEVCTHGAIIGVPHKPQLTLGALVHGNEVYGLPVILQILDLALAGLLDLGLGLGVFLGNGQAALKGVRFLERDLNRSFPGGEGCLEEKRAQELLPILARTQKLIDFHQTNVQSQTPFFIFPYSKENLLFASSLHPTLPLVTHWGASFSKEGLCTDEWVLRHGGGIGVTFEAGLRGFDPHQIRLGVDLVLKALGRASAEKSQNPLYRLDPDLLSSLPQLSPMTLAPGWTNFAPVAPGDLLGHGDGQPVFSPQTGWMLFPKYQPGPLPFRLIQKISPGDLPE
jgi:succinylglutamate desuccinylase